MSSCDTTEDYDFIVVGGGINFNLFFGVYFINFFFIGTGGAIAAARLANAGVCT